MAFSNEQLERYSRHIILKEVGAKGPVSYTHLDVYKRQLKEIENSGIAGLLIFGIPKHKDELATSAYDDNGVTCLLYTSIIDFGAYVVMFPQLIAGPIVKYRDVAAQLHVYKDRYRLKQIEEGICLFVFGLAKKVLIADTVSKLWYDIIGTYNDQHIIAAGGAGVGLENASTPLVWLGLLAYSLQLYFDFSGYSLMGIGMGKMLGFDFPMNFNMPYIARSITDFWRRWHMTLSGWFREYVYIPLGGNRRGLKRQIFNMFVVWTCLLYTSWHCRLRNLLLPPCWA